MLQKFTPCYGLQIENHSVRLEFATPYSKNADNQRFSESTSHPDKPIRFIQGRFGITAFQSNKNTKEKDLSGYYKSKYLGNGWWALKWENIHAVYEDNVIFEPGVEYFQYYTTTKGDAQIKGTNGQTIGAVVGSNMRVVSPYLRLTFQRSLNNSIARFYFEYLRAASMTFEDVKYGTMTTGLQPGTGSGFEAKKWGFRVGIELYASKFVSTRFALGTTPGIKGRNACATYLNLGIPLVFGSK